MKSQLIAIVAAVVLVGCGESQQSAPAPETKPEPPTVKAPDISIWMAVVRGDIEAVKQHIAAGTDVGAKDDKGYTPLHWAARNGHKEIAELLIAECGCECEG
ncbi:ankyrin repeat domain-containing protein [bacterium]|nr:ankyrin repeat domain-containing protein [bacterium]